MVKDHFEQLYEDYTHMMLFVSSNKLRLESNRKEMVELKKAYNEITADEDINYTMNSLEALKSRIDKMQGEIKVILYQYGEIDELIHKVDILIADYAELDIEIDLYELNGIENDLLNVKDQNDKFNILKLEMDTLDQYIQDKISELKHQH